MQANHVFEKLGLTRRSELAREVSQRNGGRPLGLAPDP